YISNFKEIHLSNDYKNNDIKNQNAEKTFIRGMTLPVLRELTNDEERKAQLVLFLYQMDMCEMVSERKCQELEKLGLSEAEQSNEEITVNNISPKLLQTADLKFGHFKGYTLPDISFLGADLRGADLEAATLTNAILTSANLSCHQRTIQAWWSWIPLLPIKTGQSWIPLLPQEDAKETICTNLHNAKLQGANLFGAVLNEANLSETNLSGARLIKTDLTGANLSNAIFRGTIILGTDLRKTYGLNEEQLNSTPPPLLCNTPLPQELNSLKNRDCENIATVLIQNYPEEFPVLETAQKFVEEQRKIIWK
ncbi:MAG: pentapeptide repeat-containing protein, partial [Leptolyngbya sp. SIO3F4]|nr:pentapeptide repeat-containing protein [Leptolyngbya sp. SIO3F4]